MTVAAYSEPSQTSKMECFVKIANGCWPLTIFAKGSIFTSMVLNTFMVCFVLMSLRDLVPFVQSKKREKHP